MNCLDFRRITETEPASDIQDFLRHKQECPVCASYALRAAHFESQLKEAFEVAVPEQLASKILMRHAFAERGERPVWRRHFPQFAAAILVTLSVIAAGFVAVNREPGLDEIVISLIQDAPYALSAKGPVHATEILAALRPVGVSVYGEIGPVTFASRCFVRGNLAGHLVLKGATAPVTIFLIPSEQVAKRTAVTSPHLSGILLPNGPGTIAIIGAPGEVLEDIEARIQEVVRWAA